MLNKIIDSAEITSEDLIIEIGPGIGGLTEALLQKAKKVIAIEIDGSLIPILKEILSPYDNLTIINQDALKVNFDEIIVNAGFKSAKIIANLPYYVTTPIIMGILENTSLITSLTVMVQKEVAKRMAAAPSTKDYGSLTLAVSYYSAASLIANVPRNCFMPRPNVDSAVIKLDIFKERLVEVKDRDLLFKIIHSGFGQRRKTLVNCLFNLSGLGFTKSEYEAILEECGFDKNIRGENLSLLNYSKLSDYISSKLNN